MVVVKVGKSRPGVRLINIVAQFSEGALDQYSKGRFLVSLGTRSLTAPRANIFANSASSVSTSSELGGGAWSREEREMSEWCKG